MSLLKKQKMHVKTLTINNTSGKYFILYESIQVQFKSTTFLRPVAAGERTFDP